MTPVFLLLLFVSLTAVPPSAANEAAEIDEDEIDLLPELLSELPPDESSDVSDIIEKANAEITTGLVHGDIRPNTQRNAVPCTARGCLWPKRGRFVYVPVSFSSRYTKAEIDFIIRGLLTFHNSTCIRFVRRQWQHWQYIHFFSGNGCWSSLGRQPSGQLISLKRRGCLFRGTVQHEVLHALGFHHEHVRSDRDRYVSILTQNIQTGKGFNFRKVQTNNLGTSYDFNSVMHYSKYAFSKNGKPTIIAKNNSTLSFGLARQMSRNDIIRVNRLYRCCE
ncbi:hatching enzyme 1.2-like [Symphorus nematophorus]